MVFDDMMADMWAISLEFDPRQMLKFMMLPTA